MLIDLIKYFAKYPAREGVLRNFKHTTGPEIIPGYNNLKTEIEALPAPLIPEIDEYVFGTDSNAIDKILREIDSYFLLLEYGRLTGSVLQGPDNRDVLANLAISVGHPASKKAHDSIYESLVMEKTLEYLVTIIKQMRIDNDDLCTWERLNENSFSLDPLDPLFAAGCVGWTLSFTKETSDLLFND